jgi:hypothetical protein
MGKLFFLWVFFCVFFSYQIMVLLHLSEANSSETGCSSISCTIYHDRRETLLFYFNRYLLGFSHAIHQGPVVQLVVKLTICLYLTMG